MQRKFGAQRFAVGSSTRQRATRLAIIAFIAADCAGIAYVQHRLSQPAPSAARFAYETPGAPAVPGYPEAAASLALAVPATSAPAAAFVPVASPAPAAAVPALSAAPLPAPEPAAMAAAAPAPQLASAPLKLAPAPTAFDHAFSLADEAPDSELRFGQDALDTTADSLASLVVLREDPAPLFDAAGIAPVTGQSATIDGPAVTDLPGSGGDAELSPVTG